MIAGLETISCGELHIGGQRVNDLAPKDRDIAMVFQAYALYPHMTVAENMGFALKMRKAPRAEIRRKVEEAAQILDITQLLERRPARSYEGGPSCSGPCSLDDTERLLAGCREMPSLLLLMSASSRNSS